MKKFRRRGFSVRGKDDHAGKFCVDSEEEEGLVSTATITEFEDGFVCIDVPKDHPQRSTRDSPAVARLACNTAPPLNLPTMLFAEQIKLSIEQKETETSSQDSIANLPVIGTPTDDSMVHEGRKLLLDPADQEEQFKSFAAANAITAFMPELRDEIDLVQITPYLLRTQTISKRVFDEAQNPYPNKQLKCNCLLSKVIDNVGANYKRFEGLCQALNATNVPVRENVKDHYRKAIQSRHLEVVLKLDESIGDAEMSSRNSHFEQTALHTATQQKELKTVEVLLQSNNGWINTQNLQGNTALHIAANNGDSEITRLLLLSNADTTIRNKQKSRLPLHLATATPNCCLSVVELLLKQDKQTVNSTDKDGNTALVIACKRNKVPVAEVLLHTESCIPYWPNKKSRTCLYYAANRGNLTLVDLLLRHDHSIAFISHQDKCGDNPLHIATMNGHFDVVQKLCELDKENVLKDTKNIDQYRPIDIARECHYKEIERYLEPLRRSNSTPLAAVCIRTKHVSRSPEQSVLYSSSENSY